VSRVAYLAAIRPGNNSNIYLKKDERPLYSVIILLALLSNYFVYTL